MADVDFSDDDLRELQKLLQSAALKAYPNPERKGCPGTKVLDEMAEASAPFKHPLYEHVATCSPCLQEMLELRGQKLRARKARSRKQLRFVMGLAATAAILGLVAFLLRYMRPSVPQRQNAQVTSNGNDSQDKQLLAGVLDYRTLPAQRGSGESGAPPQVLKKLTRRLTILLPVRSEAGDYEIEIRRASDMSRVEAYQATAFKGNDKVLKLQFEVNLSKLSSGSYFAAWRHFGTTSWDFGPFLIR